MVTRGQVKEQILHLTALVGENPGPNDVDHWAKVMSGAQVLHELTTQMFLQARKPAADQPNGMGEEFGDLEPMTDEGWMMAKRIKQS